VKQDPIPLEFTRELGQAIERAGSQSAFARRIGVSQAAVAMTVSGARYPLTCVVEALGWEKVAVLRKKQ
jgi:DNA-binding transcriptional regulator YdaS (Cro superfamily)